MAIDMNVNIFFLKSRWWRKDTFIEEKIYYFTNSTIDSLGFKNKKKGLSLEFLWRWICD
jgi:hypothetical protein